MPVPRLSPGEVLIAVEAAGVGSWDADIRGGWSPSGKPSYPLILGTDGAGRIAAVGSRVRGLRKGQRVYCYRFANPKGGFYAEYAAVAASKVALAPRRLDATSAGAVATVGLTALEGIVGALKVSWGESVIVHGASGGVGSIALQLAKGRGARVLATADGRAGVAFVRRLGADEAVDGNRKDLAAVAKRFAPDGVDAVLATIGGPGLTACLGAVRKGGRVAWPNGIDPAPRKRAGLRMTAYDAKEGARELEKLTRAIEASKLRVPIAARYPLARAADAHRRLAKGHAFGKVVLRIR
ncbi:MAG: NADP-dependent oxidoreductase [Acidobacteriota bacterium]|nr:NADP-dependent oxidoreductase [Acidobacteriota bacterium]